MARTTGFKKDKLSEKILVDANSFLRRHFSDPRLQFTSFTKAELSSDLSVANLYWDTFDSSKKIGIEEALRPTKKRFRSLFAGTLKIRHIPEIRFIYDSRFEDENHISGLLKNDESRDS